MGWHNGASYPLQAQYDRQGSDDEDDQCQNPTIVYSSRLFLPLLIAGGCAPRGVGGEESPPAPMVKAEHEVEKTFDFEDANAG